MDDISKTSEELNSVKAKSGQGAHPLSSIDPRERSAWRSLSVTSYSQTYPDTGESGEAYDAEAFTNFGKNLLS